MALTSFYINVAELTQRKVQKLEFFQVEAKKTESKLHKRKETE